MTRRAISTHEVQGWSEHVHTHRKKLRDDSIFKDKTFAQLTTEEKEVLLQTIAERLGLIKAE